MDKFGTHRSRADKRPKHSEPKRLTVDSDHPADLHIGSADNPDKWGPSSSDSRVRYPGLSLPDRLILPIVISRDSRLHQRLRDDGSLHKPCVKGSHREAREMG
jgi:hypothetical protein